MDQLDIVTRRRQQVLDNITSAAVAIEAAQKVIEDGKAELLDLDVTGRTLARLTGAAWPPVGEGHAKPETSNIGRIFSLDEKAKPTMTQMIWEVLETFAIEGGTGGLEPKQIAENVRRIFNHDAKGDYVSSIVWRMWRRNQIAKVGEGRYALPASHFRILEAADQQSEEDQSAASDSTPAQGGEARPGGGT